MENKNNWRPSPEQMRVLKNLADGYQLEPFEWEIIETLYHELLGLTRYEESE